MSFRRTATANTLSTEHHISLLDEEHQSRVDQQQDTERSDSEIPTAPDAAAAPQAGVLKRNPSSIHRSIKRQWTKQKYSSFNRDRYDLGDDTPPPPDHPEAAPTQVGEVATDVQTNYLERGRAKAKNLLKRKGRLGSRQNEHDTVIDILYENQRGIFFFGVPKYSSSSLLPSDPHPWLNAQLRTSPVDIRNAQVPDPSWEWAWKGWYVDMSRDVDEEGWEYSFRFSGGFAWHGNHPWFHSFVRRRRWLRMRKRRDAHHHTKEKAHEFTPEYFTIHPKTLRTVGGSSRANSSEMARHYMQKAEEERDAEKLDVSNIGTLIQTLKRAAVDREKLTAVREFVDTAGDELYYLAERMPEIMNLFVFQSSRRQLLVDLLQRFDTAHQHRESLKAHVHDDDEAAQKEHEDATRHADNLINAVHAADEQVKKLEYWSDIKDLAHSGHTSLDAPGRNAASSGQSSTNISNSGVNYAEAFASKQAASEGAPELHRHPEHPPSEDDDAASAVTAPSKKSGTSVVAVKHPAGKDSSTEADGYVTAAESASEIPDKPKGRGTGKSRISTLDGVDEHEDEELD